MSVDHLELDVIHNRIEDRVLFATLDAPPLNLIGRESCATSRTSASSGRRRSG